MQLEESVGFLRIADLRASRSEGLVIALPDRQAMPATLSSNQPLAFTLSQHRFHIVQAIDGGTHLRLTSGARYLGIRDLAPKIHLHLPLFLSDDSLNN